LFELFSDFPPLASGILIINGIVLMMGEHLRHRGAERHIEDMSWREALVIGLWQSAAVVPGISRTGMTIVGGILMRFQHGEAAYFSFLIATPLVVGAALLDVANLVGTQIGISGVAWAAGLVAGVAAYLSVSFLMRYFRNRDSDALDPFAYYCGLVGLVSLYVILFMQ
jgi:undecaprenyl-diphosphatase